MDAQTFANFLSDVEGNGQIDPIWIWNEEIIDGKHMEWACRELEIEPVYVILPDDIDPTRFVWSKNVERRNLKPSQRALIAAELSAWSPRDGPQSRDRAKTLQYCRISGASHRARPQTNWMSASVWFQMLQK